MKSKGKRYNKEQIIYALRQVYLTPLFVPV